MAQTRVDLKIDQRAALRIGNQAGGDAAQRAAEITADRVRSNIVHAGRVDTGRMLNSVRVTRQKTQSKVSVNTPYAMFQEEGTRAHGPRSAKVLRFTPGGQAKVVYTRWVRGVRPAHFMLDAYLELRVGDFHE